MRPALLLGFVWLAALAACGPSGGSQALPTVALDDLGPTPGSAQPAGPEVLASGIVVPFGDAQLAFGAAGLVASVNVEAGDPIRAGEVLAELENTALQVQLRQAERALRELTSPSAVAAARQTLAASAQTLDAARKRVNGLRYARATDAFIQNLSAEITLAREEVNEAARHFHDVEDLPEDDPVRAQALAAMTEAQISLNKLIGSYNWYTGEPSDIEVDLTYANFEAANAAHQEAQWHLAALQGEAVPPEAHGAGLAALQDAQDAVRAAQAQLEASRIVSPFDGTVAETFLTPGEYATPGMAALRVVTAGRLLVETTDLSEDDVADVQAGQPVVVVILPLSIEVGGRVLFVSPVAETLGGDVVYPTTVGLDSVPEGLRAGMTVEVRFGVER